MTAIMDSFQMGVLRSVFSTDSATVSTVDLSQCCRPAHWKR